VETFLGDLNILYYQKIREGKLISEMPYLSTISEILFETFQIMINY
jgi:hypothetical protein